MGSSQSWNGVIVDRTKDIERWIPPIRDLLDKQVDMFGYVNDHYAGYAPANVDQLAAALAQPPLPRQTDPSGARPYSCPLF